VNRRLLLLAQRRVKAGDLKLVARVLKALALGGNRSRVGVGLAGGGRQIKWGEPFSETRLEHAAICVPVTPQEALNIITTMEARPCRANPRNE
jgi:hypothetical protein